MVLAEDNVLQWKLEDAASLWGGKFQHATAVISGFHLQSPPLVSLVTVDEVYPLTYTGMLGRHAVLGGIEVDLQCTTLHDPEKCRVKEYF